MATMPGAWMHASRAARAGAAPRSPDRWLTHHRSREVECLRIRARVRFRDMSSARRVAVSVLSAPFLVLPLAAAPTSAAAAPICTITGFTPTTVVVGLVPAVATFAPRTTGCTVSYWNIRGGDYAFYAHKSVPQQRFAPTSNAATKPMSVLVTVHNPDYDYRTKTFPRRFTLKRHTQWDAFDASPEPVKKGAKITIRGRLRVVDWSKRTYVGYSGRGISVEFRTATGAYKRIRTATTGTGGYLSTTVTASTDGNWRLRYGGNSIAGASTVAGDFVDVS